MGLRYDCRVSSLRFRLWLIWALTLLTSLAVGFLLVRLYDTSATAQVQRAEAVVARACTLVEDRFTYYVAGPGGAASANWALEGPELVPVVAAALVHENGVEGGIWSARTGSMAYAFPTYEGSGPKTDLPEAETPIISSINAEVAISKQATMRRLGTNSQTLLLAACPIFGPVGGLTAWTMTRVQWNTGLDSLRVALGLLGTLVLLIAGWVTWMTATWARHVSLLETTLRTHDIEELPHIEPTGERELDRVVTALNDAGGRIARARARSADLARDMAATEHLAALGRVAAGIAHEIRNPMAAMRLRAENALAGDGSRLRPALEATLEQVDRVDRLVAEMLAMTQRREANPHPVELARFLAERIDALAERAAASGIELTQEGVDARLSFDPELIGRAVDNLMVNALQHTPAGGRISLAAHHADGWLTIDVADTGPGVDPVQRGRLFEPFATGRPDGTGLGLAIAREMADAHGGTLELAEGTRGARFVLRLPAPCA